MHITGHLNVHMICLIRHAEFVYGTPHSDASSDTSGFSYRHGCDMPNSCMKCRIRVWYTSFRCLDRHVGTFRSTHTWHAKFVYDMSQSDAVFTHDMPHSEASIDTDIRIDAYVTCRIHVGQVLFGYPVWILPHLTHTRLTLTSFDTYLVWHLATSRSTWKWHRIHVWLTQKNVREIFVCEIPNSFDTRMKSARFHEWICMSHVIFHTANATPSKSTKSRHSNSWVPIQIARARSFSTKVTYI